MKDSTQVIILKPYKPLPNLLAGKQILEEIPYIFIINTFTFYE